MNNYKKEGVKLTYQQLLECKKNDNLKYKKSHGIIPLKLEGKKKYLMNVCGSDTDRTKKAEIMEQKAAFLKVKCGMEEEMRRPITSVLYAYKSQRLIRKWKNTL